MILFYFIFSYVVGYLQAKKTSHVVAEGGDSALLATNQTKDRRLHATFAATATSTAKLDVKPSFLATAQ
jgi:hypothetical protein